MNITIRDKKALYIYPNDIFTKRSSMRNGDPILHIA